MKRSEMSNLISDMNKLLDGMDDNNKYKESAKLGLELIMENHLKSYGNLFDHRSLIALDSLLGAIHNNNKEYGRLDSLIIIPEDDYGSIDYNVGIYNYVDEDDICRDSNNYLGSLLESIQEEYEDYIEYEENNN